MSYAALVAHHRRLAHFHHMEAILGWDEASMMPEGGGPARAEALATLRVHIHEMASDPKLEEELGRADEEAKQGSLDPWQQANVREMRRSWTRQTCLPAQLVQESSRAESRSEQAWRKLRAANDWTGFLPFLEEVIERKREIALAFSAKLGLSPYDSLLDGFEPGAKSERIATLFGELRQFLPSFIQAAVDGQKAAPVRTPHGPFPANQQRWLGTELMKHVGFDFRHGRLDVSHHPFCGGVPQDVRITTRYDEGDFAKGLMGVLHETGHGKYEQHLPMAWTDQPVGQARSMSIHESQSLLTEMQLARSREFLTFAAPIVRKAFGEASAADPQAFTADNLYRLSTRVRPGLIRVDADELTYPCHVLLRFDLEQALIDGRLAAKDLPDAWDAGMRELLGISTLGNDKDGCMQDVHWPAGLFGYFPTYTLGALTAAQLFAAAKERIPGLLHEHVERGNFTTLDAFLQENVWELASSVPTEDLIMRATGVPLGVAAFKSHLEARYLAG